MQSNEPQAQQGFRPTITTTVSDRIQSGVWGAPDTLGKQIENQEREVARLRELVDGLNDGTKTWDEWCDELTGSDRTNVARDGAAQELDDARTELFRLYRQTVGAA